MMFNFSHSPRNSPKNSLGPVPDYAPSLEFFPRGIEAVVETEIAMYEPGLVKIYGHRWRAKLYDLNCQHRLRLHQPVLAVAKTGQVLLVIPHHCLLWDRYIDDYWCYLSPTDITTLRRYEQPWRY